jgi:glycosyltransferase involved in cell wall biosynthesis
MQIVVVSDGSTDTTEQIVREYRHDGVELHVLPHGGKAAALNHAMSVATGEILFFTDLRQYLEPESLEQLIACFADPEIGVVSGELIIRDGESEEEANVGLYWKYEKWIRKNLSVIDSIAGATGCIYAMRRNLAVPLPTDILLDDVYQPLAAFFRGHRIVMEESARAIDYPMSLNTEFHRKVRTQAGMYQILRRYPALLGPQNRMWFHFMSHKFARLMLPYILLALLTSSFWLAESLRMFALAAQGLLYGLAAIDVVVPDSAAMKRATSPVRTFVTLVAAALCAVSIWFVPSRMLWRPTTVTSPKALS